MAKAKKKSVKAVESETLTEEQFVVENPDLSTELETIVPAKFEGSKKEKLAIDEAGDNNNNKKSKKKVLVKAILGGEKAITESSDEARLLYNQSRFGSLI